MSKCVYSYATGKAVACVSSLSDPGWVVVDLDFIFSMIFRALDRQSVCNFSVVHWFETQTLARVLRDNTSFVILPLLRSCTNCLVLVVMTSPGQSWLASVFACLPGGLFVQAIASQSDHKVELQQNLLWIWTRPVWMNGSADQGEFPRWPADIYPSCDSDGVLFCFCFIFNSNALNCTLSDFWTACLDQQGLECLIGLFHLHNEV